MRISQDKSLLHFRRCLFKLGNGDLQIAEPPDSIQIPPEYLFEKQDDSGIGIRESLRHIMEMISSEINVSFHAADQQWIHR